MKSATLHGVELKGASAPGVAELLTPDALAFLAQLERELRDRRAALLRRRLERQATFDAGLEPSFLASTKRLRSDRWQVATAPAELRASRVAIVASATRADLAAALASGADFVIADFEDATAPTWPAPLAGLLALHEIEQRAADRPTAPLLLVRPRAWQQLEPGLVIDGRPMTAALFDFGLDVFHHARLRLARGGTPCYALAKLESHLEARLWSDAFGLAEKALELPRATLRAVVAIETLPALFEMEELLWELQHHAVGLSLERCNLAASTLTKLRRDPGAVTPDFAALLGDQLCAHAASAQLIDTCRRRGALPVAGATLPAPCLDGATVSDAALERLRNDLEQQARVGFVGTTVAAPALVEIAQRLFARSIASVAPTSPPGEDDLLAPASGDRTQAGLEANVSSALRFLAARHGGAGMSHIHGVLENQATFELRRAQLAHWIAHHAPFADGRPVTRELVRNLIAAEVTALRAELDGMVGSELGSKLGKRRGSRLGSESADARATIDGAAAALLAALERDSTSI